MQRVQSRTKADMTGNSLTNLNVTSSWVPLFKTHFKIVYQKSNRTLLKRKKLFLSKFYQDMDSALRPAHNELCVFSFVSVFTFEK